MAATRPLNSASSRRPRADSFGHNPRDPLYSPLIAFSLPARVSYETIENKSKTTWQLIKKKKKKLKNYCSSIKTSTEKSLGPWRPLSLSLSLTHSRCGSSSSSICCCCCCSCLMAVWSPPSSPRPPLGKPWVVLFSFSLLLQEITYIYISRFERRIGSFCPLLDFDAVNLHFLMWVFDGMFVYPVVVGLEASFLLNFYPIKDYFFTSYFFFCVGLIWVLNGINI